MSSTDSKLFEPNDDETCARCRPSDIRARHSPSSLCKSDSDHHGDSHSLRIRGRKTLVRTPISLHFRRIFSRSGFDWDKWFLTLRLGIVLVPFYAWQEDSGKRSDRWIDSRCLIAQSRYPFLPLTQAYAPPSLPNIVLKSPTTASGHSHAPKCPPFSCSRSNTT